MRPGVVAQTIGKGLVAGGAGTVALTASQMAAEKLLGEPMPTAAADAAETVLGIEPQNERAKQRLGMVTHFTYGTLWGVPRAMMELLGLHGWGATGAHLAAVQGTAAGMLPALDLAPPATQMPKKQLLLSTLHHVIYAVTAGALLSLLDRRGDRRRLAPA